MAVWRNFLILRRYKANFLFQILTSLLFGLGMLLFALLFDASVLARAVGTTNYAAFVTLGLSFQAWQGTALLGASNMFLNELSTGLIDYTFCCPFSRYWYIIGNIAALAVQETLFFIPMMTVGFWFTKETLTASGVVLGLIATMLSIIALAQLGTIFASLVLRYRQVTAIFNFFNFAFQMLTGMFVPLELLPASLQIIGECIPFTFGMDLLRHYLMGTKSIMTIGYEWIALLIEFAAYVSIALLAVFYLERSAKEQGLHYA
jgi:ABC-2 type transport system permease protein